MAGARFPSNAAAVDSAITAASNRRAASFYATSAQSLYSDLWQDMRTYVDAYCRVTRSQQHSARTSSSSLTDFSSSPASNQSSLSYQQPYSTYPKELDGAVNFADLASLENPGGNARAISGDSHSVAPTIQFDLGSNLLGASSQQVNASTNFSVPRNYPGRAAVNSTQADPSQACFSSDSPVSSSMWNLVNSSNNIGNNGIGQNFGCPSPGRSNNSGMTNNAPTVDFTARWGMRSNAQQSPVHQSNVVGNNVRLRPYVREPSVGLMRKIGRALEQRLYVIDRKVVGDLQAPTACDYQVLGATGNVYTVRLATIPSCTCPDTHHPCKHILFIMLRVLKLSSEDYRIWQDALFASEVSELIRRPLLDSDALIANHVTEGGAAYSGDADHAGLKNLQREVGGDCPVCFEEMGDLDGSPKEEVSFCKVCGNNVHKDCFQRWSLSKLEAGERATCIICRSPWFDDTQLQQLKKRKAASEVPADGYVNIADYATHHQHDEDMSLESLYPSLRPKFVPEWRGC